MTWRPWVVALAMFIALALNIAMLATEDVKPPAAVGNAQVIPTDRLVQLVYTDSNRLTNFTAMGLPKEIGKAASSYAAREHKERGAVLEKSLRDHADIAVRIFCPSADPPTRWQAMKVLVASDTNGRRVIGSTEISELAIQDWYGGASVDEAYTRLELAPDDKYQADATFMGAAAFLVGQEGKVFDAERPWGEKNSMLNGWSSATVVSEYDQAQVFEKTSQYFGLMHLLTEYARAEKGICSN